MCTFHRFDMAVPRLQPWWTNEWQHVGHIFLLRRSALSGSLFPWTEVSIRHFSGQRPLSRTLASLPVCFCPCGTKSPACAGTLHAEVNEECTRSCSSTCNELCEKVIVKCLHQSGRNFQQLPDARCLSF